MKWPTVGRDADRVRAIEDPLALILPDAAVFTIRTWDVNVAYR
jgi:hypothetical protein